MNSCGAVGRIGTGNTASTLAPVDVSESQVIINEIYCLIDRIEKRLEIVLLPNSPEVSQKNPSSQKSSLVMILDEIIQRLNNLQNRINV